MKVYYCPLTMMNDIPQKCGDWCALFDEKNKCCMLISVLKDIKRYIGVHDIKTVWEKD